MTRFSLRFKGGAAEERAVSVARAPYFIRVTLEGGKVDALDALDDLPRPGEEVVAYQYVSTDGQAFVDGVHPVTRKRCGWQETSMTYKVCAEQPNDETIRDNLAWKAWTEAYYKKLMTATTPKGVS